MTNKTLLAAAGIALAVGYSGAASADQIFTSTMGSGTHSGTWTAVDGGDDAKESSSSHCPNGSNCTRLGWDGDEVYMTDAIDLSLHHDIYISLDMVYRKIDGGEGVNMYYALDDTTNWVHFHEEAGNGSDPYNVGTVVIAAPPAAIGNSAVRFRFENDANGGLFNGQNERAFIGPISIDGNLNHINTPGVVSLSGDIQAEALLTVNVTDADSISGPITYSWTSDGDPIPDNNQNTYTTQIPDDVGNIIQVSVSYTDDMNSFENITSADFGPVTAPSHLGVVSIDNTSPVIGDTLTTSVIDSDGLIGVTISYTWSTHYFDATNNPVTDVGIAFGPTYDVQQADLDKSFSVNATYTDNNTNVEDITSATTDAAINPNVIGQVSISGDAIVGQTLTANVTDADGISGDITYTWFSAGYEAGSLQTYEITAADIDNTVSVNVQYEDDLSNNEFISSLPSGPVVEEEDDTTPPDITPPGCNTLSANPGAGIDPVFLFLIAAGLFYNRKFWFKSKQEQA